MRAANLTYIADWNQTLFYFYISALLNDYWETALS